MNVWDVLSIFKWLDVKLNIDEKYFLNTVDLSKRNVNAIAACSVGNLQCSLLVYVKWMWDIRPIDLEF